MSKSSWNFSTFAFYSLADENRPANIPNFLSDQNECDDQPCHSNATCNNTEGSYKCTCMLSYTGDGETCTWYKGNVILLKGTGSR